MASISSEIAEKELAENGFFDFEDSSIGEALTEMESQGFRFHSEFGLEFGKRHVLDHEVSHTVIYGIYLTIPR
jgi:hypothetical protein